MPIFRSNGYTVHASMATAPADRLRLSTDSRYPPRGSVMDERWIGVDPVGHTAAGKRGRVC